jgi:hypothetical protein
VSASLQKRAIVIMWLASGLVNNLRCCVKRKPKNVHESKLGADNRDDIERKSYGAGDYFQPQAGLPVATQGPPKNKLRIAA